MKIFQYEARYGTLLTPEVISVLVRIHERKASQNRYFSDGGKLPSHYAKTAKLETILAGIGGGNSELSMDDLRIKKIISDKTIPKTAEEKELAGYRDVYLNICENYAYLPPRASVFTELYQGLYKFSGMAGEAVFAESLSLSYGSLCNDFAAAEQDGLFDTLLLIPLFLRELKRMELYGNKKDAVLRLVLHLLLYRAGCRVGEYVSIDRVFASERADSEYSPDFYLNNREQEDIYSVTCFLKLLLSAYEELEETIREAERAKHCGLSKPERIRETIREAEQDISKAEIMEKCPEISQITIQRTLSELQKQGDIIKRGGGRYTTYLWNKERRK